GRVLIQHAETVLAALEQTTAALAAAATDLSGPLRIGAFPTAVRTLLPAALVSLADQHPGLELMVTELDPVEVPATLRERQLDVGLLHDYDAVPVDPEPGLDTAPLLEETVFLAVPGSAPRTEETDVLHAVRDARWIMASPGTLCHTVTLQVCRAAGFTPRARHNADDFATVLALVAADQGVSLVPQLAADQPPAGVRLHPLPTRRRTRIAYRKGAAAHPAIAAFVSAIRASTGIYLDR
ncbi:MAG: LysR substrate-binding domain-containing protein, partial [Actinopolymorphaceae bacterium]